jgi:hypothetical protein
LALGQIAASNVATAMLLREFRARSDFEFFNTIGQKAKYSPGVNDFRVAPNNGHRPCSRTPFRI